MISAPGNNPVLATIRESWGWTGLDPAEVVAVNQFGNVVVRAADGKFWRICPEGLSCEIIAPDAVRYAALQRDDEFNTGWHMQRLADVARAKFGPPPAGRCYCLKLPAVLGGRYDADNLGTISTNELLAFSGDIARQIKDVPDGGQVIIDWQP